MLEKIRHYNNCKRFEEITELMANTTDLVVDFGSFGAMLPSLVKAITDGLGINQIVIELRLDECYIGDAGATHVADMLKINKTIKTLNLNSNSITLGGRAIAEALGCNKTLTELSLRFNCFDRETAKKLLISIIKNCHVKSLYIRSSGDNHCFSYAIDSGELSLIDHDIVPIKQSLPPPTVSFFTRALKEQECLLPPEQEVSPWCCIYSWFKKP